MKYAWKFARHFPSFSIILFWPRTFIIVSSVQYDTREKNNKKNHPRDTPRSGKSQSRDYCSVCDVCPVQNKNRDDKQSQHLESTFLATLSTVRAPRVRARALFSLQHWTGQRKCDLKKNLKRKENKRRNISTTTKKGTLRCVSAIRKQARKQATPSNWLKVLEAGAGVHAPSSRCESAIARAFRGVGYTGV